MHRLKRCEYNNKDEGNSPNTLNDKNYQASPQKFRQMIIDRVVINISVRIISILSQKQTSQIILKLSFTGSSEFYF